ncbi:MAG: AAA family ATPase [Saprospiraceae bacterium]|nr:AAA family ATPase [Saprospiraceae bacterium]
MLPTESAPLLYRELSKIAAHDTWTPSERILALAALMERIFLEATRREQIAFSTLFARISYAGHLFHFQADTLRRVHGFRLRARRVRAGAPGDAGGVLLGLQAVAETVLVLTGAAIPPDVLELLPASAEVAEPGQEDATLGYAARVRVVAFQDLPEEHCLLAADDEHTAPQVRVRYGLPERNENFGPSIELIRKVFGFPVSLNLLDVDISAGGEYRPRAIVVEPDYLVDVSAIAECFKDTGPEPFAYLARKFLPHETTEAILLGNIANYFLDRLINEPDAAWQEVFGETFRLYPFAYAPMSDAQVRAVSGKAQKHFVNLRQMAAEGLSRQGIEPAGSFLEPAFFSEQYGIQGRLDLFYRTEEKAAIVELKSGTPFKPNSYGIQRSHFTQTLLYDLLVRSVYGRATDPAKYILYSGADLNVLRFAPTVEPEQWEALQLRNQLLAIERLLAGMMPGEMRAPVFARLRAINGKGFLQRDFGRFENAYAALQALEKKYFHAFCGFTAREHWLAKIGSGEEGGSGGHAALWRDHFSAKQQAFSILSHLEIVENGADQLQPTIVFKKTEKTPPLANFRVGDIAVLYPALDESDTVLHYQVIKCTIAALGEQGVTVQLRYRQHNLKPFSTPGYWCLEPDFMDMGFTGMYRGLFEWAEAGDARRRLLLGLEAPRNVTAGEADSPPGVGEDNTSLFRRMTASKDYFLLWGPPGTGKTSVMLRQLAAWTLEHTTDNLLLLAFTNRAVDEICEALDDLGGDIRTHYLRIGSQHSTAERFRSQLMSAKIADAGTRSELRAVLEKHRIVVSTVASFGQHDGLLKIKKFQRLIVDEASQILEPQLVGLLTRFDHFILIGDHQQLPAVTVQNSATAAVEDADLQSIGLRDLRDSYFERLYRRCRAQGWHWAYGQLSRQGRMHEAIMEFPNEHFYGGTLNILDPAPPRQTATLQYRLPGLDPSLEQIVSKNRVVFLPADADERQPNQKTNRNEAELAARLVLLFRAIREKNGLDWHPDKTLGIITPWRAQIAQLRESLAAAGLDPDSVAIDTVERYQGGARDIIILSTCVNTEIQLKSLVNLSGEGVDRKLNVALTRAREHLIMLGNEFLLQQDERYRAFISRYKVNE